MMRRALIWLAVLVVLVGATAGLLWWTTATAAQFRVDGERLDVSGQLTLASTERLDRLLEEHPQLTTLVIGRVSSEGDVTALLQKGLLIRRAGLTTEVAPGVSLEGDAVYLLMSGVERRLGQGAQLVLTGWQSPVGPAADLPEDHPAHQERLDYVTRMLGSAETYWISLDASEDERNVFGTSEALAIGLLTSD